MSEAIRAARIIHRYPGASVPGLRGVDFSCETGTVTTLIGVNGSGKSTLLRILSGAERPESGTVMVAGLNPHDAPRRDVAKRVAVMHQTLPPVPGLRVADLVAQGRYAQRGALGMLAGPEPDTVRDALTEVGLVEFAGRALDSLSGGERQRVRLAAALAQASPILMLDEPTAHLDVRHQLELLELVQRVAQTRGLTVVMVLHDIDHAVRFSDSVGVLAGGVMCAHGAPEEVVNVGLLREVFGVAARVVEDPLHGKRYVVDAPIAP